MRICKYCKKPISDNNVWNPDEDGNGYHHSCIIEIELRSRDRQIYDKGRADIVDKIRAEIENHCGLTKENHCKYCSYCNSVMGVREILEIIDKCKTESEK